MKKLAPVLVILGLLAVIVACWPQLVVKSPEDQFGPYQMWATIGGIALIVLGLVTCACKCSCATTASRAIA